ncbi:hypothetical protein CCUS01_14112 [Colletotrichum cuscutae]|uniref:Major facilitator superfamily (MFS) profile domain-containing protein n=1 Tax=Colletotrichum cuscutae TaxID=1209917 RepID=A0AAJ0DM00_9PEZI|nr:hypothetical protein CCUS01_14112 [Colletotrichum cuscutae]
MYGPSMDNVSVRAGIEPGHYAGYVFGSGGSAYCMDKMSHRWTLLFGACIGVAGAVLQTAAVNPAMMIVGRAFSGFPAGMVYPTAPVYLAEVSPPENRGFLVGSKGLVHTLGFFVARWVGYAGSFDVSELQCCVPLATQIPPALRLAVITLFLPYSPRWLAMRERYNDAKKIMYSLHAQRVRKRYSGLYGFMAVIGQIMNVFFVADHWTRRITIISGNFTLAVLLAVLTAFSKLFQDDSNPAGSHAGVAFILLFAFAYYFFFNNVNCVLVAKTFSLDLRGVGVGFSVFIQAVTAIWLSYAAPATFDAIERKFYFVHRFYGDHLLLSPARDSLLIT